MGELNGAVIGGEGGAERRQRRQIEIGRDRPQGDHGGQQDGDGQALGARHGNSATRPAGETGTGGLLESGRLGQTLAPLIVAAAASPQGTAYGRQGQEAFHAGTDRKSTRLNSSN